MVYLCGDIHGTVDIQKVIEFFETDSVGELLEDKYLIILGDTSICWDDSKIDKSVRNILLGLPVTAILLVWFMKLSQIFSTL
jgi:hypothetical protein